MTAELRRKAIPPNERGRNRQGYYLALLYALERLYALEAARKGEKPDRWRPLPRYRPDQFAQWAYRVVATEREEPPPRDVSELCEALSAVGLARMALVLAHVTRGHPVALEPPRLEPGHEAHPQARKVALAIRARLDPAWWRALVKVARRQRREGTLDAAALALGGLPPKLPRLVAQVRRGLHEASPGLVLEDLTLLQAYGLMTGGSHAGVIGWGRVLRSLGSLPLDDALALRHHLLEKPDALERPCRVSELPPRLASRLSQWPREVLDGANMLMRRRWAATLCYLEDNRELTRLKALRSSAELHLAEPFPRTVRYLNALLFTCFEGVVYRLIDDVLGPAQGVSQQIWLELLASADSLTSRPGRPFATV